MDFPPPHRDLSTGPGRSGGGGSTEPSPSLNSPDPAPATIVPNKRRRNSAATGGNNKRATLGHTRVHKRHGHGRGHSQTISSSSHGHRPGSRGSALASPSRAGSIGPDTGGMAASVPPPTNTRLQNSFFPPAGQGRSSRETPTASMSRQPSVALEPVTETMSTPERLAALERNKAAEAAYNDDRRRNNQSAKRSRLKKEMYMVEMDMAIKSYRRNVLEFSGAYNQLKGILMKHNLFTEAELGEGFVEPVVWHRPVFMPEQEADIADHRAKLEKAAQQADLPKLGLDFAEKVCELVGREVPMEDGDSAVKALAEHHQKIEDCERRQYQLLLQFHEFERKLEETKAKMGEQGRRKVELDAAMEKYKHLGAPLGQTDGTALTLGTQGLGGVPGQGLVVGMNKLPLPALTFPPAAAGGHQTEVMAMGQRNEDLFGDSKVIATTGLAARLGQEQREQQQQAQHGQAQEGESKTGLLSETNNELVIAEQSNGDAHLQATQQVVPETTTATIALEDTDEHKAFLAELDEYAEAHGGDLDDGMSVMIKPDDLFGDMDSALLFGGLAGSGGCADFEAMCGMSDDSLFGGGGDVDFFGGEETVQGQQQQQFFENQNQGFVLAGNTQLQQQHQQQSSPAVGSDTVTGVGHGHGAGVNAVNPFSSPVFRTAHTNPMPANWPGGNGHGLLGHINTPVASPRVGQGIFLGNANSLGAVGQHNHNHGHGHGQWQAHPHLQFQNLHQLEQQQQGEGRHAVWGSPALGQQQGGNNEGQ